MKILVVGNGGREMALKRAFEIGGNEVIVKTDTNNELLKFAINNQIDFTFVGPEIPLVQGIVNDFQKAGLKIFGPTKKAAMIEGSKNFAKELMKKYNIPTASYKSFDNREDASLYLIDKNEFPTVIKLDGLAAGKGVFVANDFKEAKEALDLIYSQNKNQKIVIEEFLDGEEFSLLSFVKNGKVYPMPPAQDHKRVFDFDKGPNTGGMGAFCPVPNITNSIYSKAIEQIVVPTINALKNEGIIYEGVLYAGLISTQEGPKVIEFNARFGDPETQIILPLLKTPLADIIAELLNVNTQENQNNHNIEIEWEQNKWTLGVVVCANGYPGEYLKGIDMSPLIQNKPIDIEIDLSGIDENNLSTGGRIMMVWKKSDNLKLSKEAIYDYLNKYKVEGTFFRNDIGRDYVK